ncbi:MerR family transcriptional regulator [Promicromonospora citrea]|uniref:MerR family transcriptional regulator n=2 Tax=Promicromonospora citrea TaxID=43677 RepID=A0A8H9GNM6_9MICO|nr:MerR family transcriptional regulator [Promicromonospora citrea]
MRGMDTHESTQHPTLYPIGDVARRTGLSVSAVRFYADEGVVPPAETTPAGHRLYGAVEIARLEFVRTLRELGSGLEQIRRLLTGQTELRYLLAEHLDVVERQGAELRARRAALRALVREEDPEARVALLTRLAALPDHERERLVDDFWREVTDGLPADVADRALGARPRLPDDPTAAQLDAWVTLAELLQDTSFRTATRSYLRETYADGPGSVVATEPVHGAITTLGEEVMTRLLAAHASGLPGDDPHAVALADRVVRRTAEAIGVPADDAVRERVATGYERMADVVRTALRDPAYQATQRRYLDLVAVINGVAAPDAELEAAAGPDAAGSLRLAELGPWLARAVRAGA